MGESISAQDFSRGRAFFSLDTLKEGACKGISYPRALILRYKCTMMSSRSREARPLRWRHSHFLYQRYQHSVLAVLSGHAFLTPSLDKCLQLLHSLKCRNILIESSKAQLIQPGNLLNHICCDFVHRFLLLSANSRRGMIVP